MTMVSLGESGSLGDNLKDLKREPHPVLVCLLILGAKFHQILEKWHSNITKSCACHEKSLSSLLILITDATSFTLHGATNVTAQRHQILRLPRKMTFHKNEENVLKTDEGSFTIADDSRIIRP